MLLCSSFLCIRERLNDETELVPAVVQCLGNLNLTSRELMAEVMLMGQTDGHTHMRARVSALMLILPQVLETALGALQSVNMADIPVLMRFIIQNSQAKDMPFVSALQE